MKSVPKKQSITDIANRHGIADLYVFGSSKRDILAYINGQPILQQPPSDVDFGVLPINLMNGTRPGGSNSALKWRTFFRLTG